MPDAGPGGRVPAAVRAAPGARPGRAGDHRRDGRARGVHRGQYLAHAKQLRRSSDPARSPPSFDAAFGRDSGGLVARVPARGRRDVVVALGSVLGTVEDVVDELRDEGVRVGALGITCSGPGRSTRCATHCGPRSASSCSSRRSPSASAASSARRAAGARRLRLAVHDVVAGLGGRPVTRRRCAGCSTTRRPAGWTGADLPRPRPRRSSIASSSAPSAPSGPHAENMLRDLGAVRRPD